MIRTATEIAATLINPGTVARMMREDYNADPVRRAEAEHGPEAAAHLLAALHCEAQALLYRWTLPPGFDGSVVADYKARGADHRARFAALAQGV